MINKKLISSYDESEDMFYIKINEDRGYVISFELCDGVYLNLNKFNELDSIEIENASELLGFTQNSLSNGEKKIIIISTEDFISFKFFLNNKNLLERSIRNEYNLLDTILILE